MSPKLLGLVRGCTTLDNSLANGRGAEDEALLVGRQGRGGEVRHGVLRAAQVPSVGEEVKAKRARRWPEREGRVLAIGMLTRINTSPNLLS